ARKERGVLRAKVARLVGEDGLAVVSACTHPAELWQEEPISPYERYARLEEEFQDATRSNLVFGLHIHVGIDSHERAVALINQLRTWLPHLLALSTSSPLWAGRFTGLKSYRSEIGRASCRDRV